MASSPENANAIREGTAFRTAHGRRSGSVHGMLGEGGQGAVYAVDCEGAALALKWYHPHVVHIDLKLRDRLMRAVHRGPPSDQFLWPLDIVEIGGRQSFGYLMGLREQRFRCMSDLIARPPRRLDPPLATRLILCLRIAENFLKLHANGFCYQDVNFGNIFFDPETGDVRICDNDNVDIDGISASVYGTRKFMAPEIVRREAMPSTRTDLYSLAVLFFYVLAGWHPLDGQREAEAKILDGETERRLYGETPCFLFDDHDAGNGPVRGMHDGVVARWATLGPRLHALFARAFCAGLRDPDARVHEPEWIKALAGAAVAVASCPRCGAEHVFDHAAETPVCAVCGAARPVPPHLLIDRHPVVALPGRALPAHLLQPGAIDFGKIGARVEPHPFEAGRFGLRNAGDRPWQVRMPDGRQIAVPPGRAVLMADGVEIDFGERRAKVHWPQALTGGAAS